MIILGKLKYKFIIPTIILILSLLVIYMSWTYYTQRQQSINEMREKAQVLTKQIDATWEFMVINQDKINYNSDGYFEFKGLSCSMAGMSIGAIFSEKSDYKTRYIRETPRNPINEPDDFEMAQLAKFDEDSSLTEAWEIVEYDGERMFRYVTPMYIEQSCLECHGGPEGELDVAGYPKEGLQVGDRYGAISIMMPTKLYDQALARSMLWACLFFLFLLVVGVISIYYFVTNLVTKPLGKLERAVQQVEKGDLNVNLNGLDAHGEIRDLADHFDNMAKQLKDLYGKLESKVEQRTLELARANEDLRNKQIQLEAANQRLKAESQYKSDFLAIVSHELRTPLTSIIAFTEILLTENNTKDNEYYILGEIKSNSQVLLNMINNILDMARLETGKNDLLLETVDLVDVINNVEAVIRPLAHNKNINFTTNVERDVPLIIADYEKIRRIVENLAGNAIKFTKQNGNVEILVSLDNQKENILIKVKDDGIGICKEDQPYIFDKFVQVDTSSSRRYNGSGLGLALAWELTKLHGGTIVVDSELNKGSTFIVSIPIDEAKRGGENEKNNVS